MPSPGLGGADTDLPDSALFFRLREKVNHRTHPATPGLLNIGP